MSLILKSNVVAKKYLGTLLERVLPKPTIYADLVGERYIKNSLDSSLSELTTLISQTGLGYTDKDGEYKTAAANTPRIHHDTEYGKGLLSEQRATNLFLNANAPATQTINVSVTAFDYLVLQVWGSGSVIFSVGGVQIATVTEANPYAYSHPTAGAVSIVATVVGSVNFVQVFKSYSKTRVVTKSTGLAPSSVLGFKKPVGDTNYTFVIRRQLLDTKITNITGYAKANVNLFAWQLHGSTTLGVYDKYKTNILGSLVYTLASTDTETALPSIQGSANQLETVAVIVNGSDSTVTIIKNGHKVTFSTATNALTAIDKVVIGNSWGGLSNTNAQSVLIKEYLYYDYAVSEDIFLKNI